MNKLPTVAFIASLLLIAGYGGSIPAAEPSKPSGSGPVTVRMNDVFKISEQDLPGMEQEALAGDAHAAGKISEYFDMYVHNAVQASYWLQIAAENDLLGAQYDFGRKLFYSRNSAVTYGETLEKVRACYWVKKALAKGFIEPARDNEMHSSCHIN